MHFHFFQLVCSFLLFAVPIIPFFIEFSRVRQSIRMNRLIIAFLSSLFLFNGQRIYNCDETNYKTIKVEGVYFELPSEMTSFIVVREELLLLIC